MLVRTPNLLTLHSIVIYNFICFVVVVGPFALQFSGSCGRLGTPAEGGVFKTKASCHSHGFLTYQGDRESHLVCVNRD